jgi:hypothetical protein
MSVSPPTLLNCATTPTLIIPLNPKQLQLENFASSKIAKAVMT